MRPKIFVIMDCKLVYLSLLESCFLSYNRPLCIINGFFYLKKKQYFILMTFKCLSLPQNQRGLAEDKNIRVVLVPWLRIEVCPYSYFWCWENFWGPWVSFFMIDEFSVRVTKITSRNGLSWTHSLPFYFYVTYLNLVNYSHNIKSI